jgi:hypothetical protein
MVLFIVCSVRAVDGKYYCAILLGKMKCERLYLRLLFSILIHVNDIAIY